MAHAKNHDYHILPPSIWPFIGAIGAFVMFVGGVFWMHKMSVLGLPNWALFALGVLTVFYTMFGWWNDVANEGNTGDHTPVVQIGLRYGIILFIISEVMFFVAWFWAFFKNALYPMGEMSPIVDGVWPPEGIVTFDPWHLPLINTLILLLSGVAVTWAHHAIAHDNDRKTAIRGLAVAVFLGVAFTILQAYEYSHAAFGLDDTVYGGVFFMATGFHGFHVIIGTIFLFVCLVRMIRGHMTQTQHVGFEAAAWYWHFVDVVWLFLFAAIYVWGR
ncbi:cytochrome c oxidase subunit 3 [Paracoccus solventivorans]|uniref:Cytochrome c oxidase subunit 3 n=1 Tax=Paracoccus solventivorans TaxID=53463 RepID=A0A1M7DFG0_9RHOB|nr:cytochrome c oxidase subunit 3 [Paracoccus solventivorans]SHL78190.1 cytochrome c oxidase subunit 3 [Paracoccus solventivorans]HHW33596.1 cytochrome c oxidase subunit 3 [Paracoccus solventivorans]HMM09254.1 cytochrome c oxidase subunit 3 [Paracoccus solventivorans]